MRKREIKSILDLTQEVISLSQKARHEVSEDNLITEQSELLSSNLPENKNLKFIGPIFAIVGVLAIVGSIYLVSSGGIFWIEPRRQKVR